MSQRTRVGVGLVCSGIAAGILLMAVSGGNAATGVIGLVLMGVAGIAGVSWGFYAIGRSEDREREERHRANDG